MTLVSSWPPCLSTDEWNVGSRGDEGWNTHIIVLSSHLLDVNLSRYLLNSAAMMGRSAISDPHKAAGLQSHTDSFSFVLIRNILDHFKYICVRYIYF